MARKAVSNQTEIGGRTLKLTVGKVAEQANMAVLATYGETCVLATVVASALRPDLDYFPLHVDYLEKLYAGGRIKGSRWVKREGRPSDEAILAGRLIDRSIRPLFPKGYKNEVQVTITVLSVDGENDPVVLAALATSAALTFSDIPWQGPIATVAVGSKDSHYFVNPVASEREISDLDLIVSGTDERVVMIEAKANQVDEEKMAGAVDFARQEIKGLIDFVQKMAKEVGKEKSPFEDKEDAVLIDKVYKVAKKSIEDSLDRGEDNFEDLEQAVVEKLPEDNEKAVKGAFSALFKKIAKERLLEKKRPDGRKIDEIRPLNIEVGVLPRTHGSAIFSRGKTQVLTITTLGPLSLEQWIENAEGEETKRYIHHYSMPPFASGETGFIRGPGRREIGHGALAEKALEPVLPTEKDFPYAIRVVSEVMSSNGSTSMASVCGSTLSLMDAGVPIKAPVAGIAMGLVTGTSPKSKVQSQKSSSDYVILTDIAGIEDFNGEMDFKVAGTKQGITAIQLDVKNNGLTAEIIRETLTRAREARLFILEAMTKVLPEARQKLSQYAPKVQLVQVDKEKIGEVIGPGGKMIRQIIEKTGCEVNVEDNGQVTVSGTKKEEVQQAVDWIKSLVREVKEGEVFDGVVKRIQPFGAFVEILPQKEGLVHVSQIADHFIQDPSEVVSIGDKVKVKVREIDDRGRINLTMLLDGKKKPLDNQPPRRHDHYDRFSSRLGRPSRRNDGPRGRYNRNDSQSSRRPASSSRFSHFRSPVDRGRGR